MTLLAQLAALLAIVSTAIVYGIDAFCALVLRSADAHETPADARTLQRGWDPHHRPPEPSLQGLAVLALGASLTS